MLNWYSSNTQRECIKFHRYVVNFAPGDCNGVSGDIVAAVQARNSYFLIVFPVFACLNPVTQGYPAMIYLLHDIDVLTKADIFVGTFSSNLGRFITTLRGLSKDSFGAEPDVRWRPN